MKNVFKFALFSLSVLTLASCGGDEESASEGGIDTGDVKGDIDLMGAESGKMNYNHNGKDCKAYQINLNDGAELVIYPDDVTFEQATGDIERKKSSSFYDVEILKSEDNYIFFKETKVGFGDKKREEKPGYGFILVVKKDDKMNYILETNGDTPLDPIWNKADAEKLLKIAQSFVPKK